MKKKPENIDISSNIETAPRVFADTFVTSTNGDTVYVALGFGLDAFGLSDDTDFRTVALMSVRTAKRLSEALGKIVKEAEKIENKNETDNSLREVAKSSRRALPSVERQ